MKKVIVSSAAGAIFVVTLAAIKPSEPMAETVVTSQQRPTTIEHRDPLPPIKFASEAISDATTSTWRPLTDF